MITSLQKFCRQSGSIHHERRSQSFTFLKFLTLSSSERRMTLIATNVPSLSIDASSWYAPAQMSENPPATRGFSSSFSTFDSGTRYESGRMPCSPQSFTSARKHRLLVCKLIRLWESNIYRSSARCTDGWVKVAPAHPFKQFCDISRPIFPHGCPGFVQKLIHLLFEGLRSGSIMLNSDHCESFGVAECGMKERLDRGNIWIPAT